MVLGPQFGGMVKFGWCWSESVREFRWWSENFVGVESVCTARKFFSGEFELCRGGVENRGFWGFLGGVENEGF